MKQRSESILNRLLLLNGLAIIGVVANHAAGLVFLLDSTLHYFLLAVFKLTAFAVPSFLFVSGFFASYMARGKSFFSLKVVKTRFIGLLIPYVFWSLLYFAIRYVKSGSITWLQCAKELVYGQRFWFLNLLCQLYFFLPLLVRMARKSEKMLMVASALVAVVYICLYYIKVIGIFLNYDTLLIDRLITLPYNFILRWQFFFVMGLVGGFHITQLRGWADKYKWPLLGATIMLAGLSLLEAGFISPITPDGWWWWGLIMSFPSMLFVICFILCFCTFLGVNLPMSGYLYKVGKVTLGIYVLNRFILELVASAVQELAPWSLAHAGLYYLVLVISTLELSRLLMRFVVKSPVRKLYPYLFG